jgi:MtaA/CmuA family methyltransferase
LARLESRTTDRLPLMPITMMFAADTAGVLYGDYARDHRVLAEAQLKTAAKYRFDYLSAISDPARETSDLGGSVRWFDNQPPAIDEERAVLADKSALKKLPAPERVLGARMEDRLNAVRMLRERAGNDFLVEGWVEGPCALGADLRGLNTLMLDFADDPRFVEDLFAYVVALESHFARLQVDAGADLIGIGDAACSLIGPRRYQDPVLEWEQRLIAAIESAGAATRLHICGNTRRLLPAMGRTGARMIDLDYPSPMAEARAAMNPDQVLLGNLDPVRAVRDSHPARITADLEACWHAAGPHYIAGAGCEIARGTPEENLLAFTAFAASH